MKTFALIAALGAAASGGIWHTTQQDPETPKGPDGGHSLHSDWKDNELPTAVMKGLEFLVAAQGSDGGYGQDGTSQSQGVDPRGHDVANTAMVALTLLRTGTTPTEGPYTDQLLAALDFVLTHVEKAPDEGLAITDRQGTQIQAKLGQYVDTFLASMLLSELNGRMPDEASEKRVFAALDKVIDKIEKNQQANGSWSTGGWAPVISTSLASRGLENAKARGYEVDEEVLARVDDYSASQFDGKRNEFKVGEGDAGIPLYKVAQVMEQASRDPDSAEKRDMVGAAGELLESQSFQDGFGSMGGEEFISYMNISDSLLRAGGEKWDKWNDGIKTRLAKLQNKDGSWAGHHCITGRIACTSAAIMTIVAERTAARPQ